MAAALSFLKLAWRNIWRNMRRTILTLLAITFSTAILIFFVSLQLSAYQASINANMSIFQGHMQVQVKGYLDQPQMRKSIQNVAAARTAIEKTPGLSAVALRANGFALISSESRTYGGQIVGVEPDREPLVSTIPGLIREGRYFNNINAEELVVGTVLARNLHVSIGQELTLLGQGRDGSLVATAVPVVGFFESGISELDRNVAQMPLGAFQTLFGMEDQAHVVVLKSSDFRLIDSLKNELETVVHALPSGDELVVLSWQDLSPGLKEAIELDMSFGWLFYCSLVVVVVLSILNTFLMAILERTREFGLLLALGMRNWSVALLVIIESVLLTALGLGIGVVIGGSIVLYFGAVGFDIPGGEEIMKLWHIPATIRPQLSLASLSLGPVLTLIGAVVAVLFPALKILKLRVVSALRAT